MSGVLKLAEALPQSKIVTLSHALSLTGNSIGPRGGKGLAIVLPRTKITDLNLSNNALCGVHPVGGGIYTTDGINALCEGLQGSTVTSLNVTRNGLNSLFHKKGKKALQAAAGKHIKLKM